MNDRPIHHVCYIVDDIPKAVDQWVEATGAGPFFHLGEHVEFDRERCCWEHAIEVLREAPTAINGLLALFAAGAEGWDGSEPLREMPEG